MSERMALMKELSGNSKHVTHDCPNCNNPTYCAMEAGKSSSTCWCMSVKREETPEALNLTDKCLCRSCLTK